MIAPRTDPVTPNWRVLAIAMAVSALLALPISPPSTALYWYIFPLFGLGIAYVVQFHDEFPVRWQIAGVAMAVVSVVALALDWPYSGHVMWNVVFIGHAWMTGKRRTLWMALLVASLVYLIVLKLVSQTGRDLLGAAFAAVVGAVVLAVIGSPRRRR